MQIRHELLLQACGEQVVWAEGINGGAALEEQIRLSRDV